VFLPADIRLRCEQELSRIALLNPKKFFSFYCNRTILQMNKIETTKPAELSRTAYDHQQNEAKWTDYWFEHEVFNLDLRPDFPPYSIALPPPNITGNLHMGHALNGTLQDVLIRLKRMQGYTVLWQPGTDHAGISTQLVVERDLKKKGIQRRDLGREAFVQEVWKWRKQYGDQIMLQYKRLGVSFAWDRLAFTMDEYYVRAIYRAFVTLFKDGHIYRGNRVSNWCPRCLTTVSDLEVQHEETKGALYLIHYKLKEGTGALTVATTRPETLLADVAVAVHPDDPRFTGRELPVVADSYVDREFGTGALKITPAHDPNDWEVAQRHKLPAPLIIDEEGKLLANEFVPAKYQGKDRFQVRDLIVEDLKEAGLLEETKEYTHSVGHCERCNTVIEPLLSDQWYVRMKELAEPAIKCVEEGRIVFCPERYTATYIDWLNNVRDWCISRQLWWGHRIPVWTCTKCSDVDAYEEPPSSCSKCGATTLEQDPDVLDTWFSSGLWPFATLNWPDASLEFKTFYPTTALCTAREIINLWVSRMIFLSLKLVKTIPFKHVLIHPVIQTADGKRMSKSKGNAVDPMDMITKYGADANRFWFASIGIKGDQDVRFREDKLEEYKRFVNKLWNAGRFVIGQLVDYKPQKLDHGKLTLADRWILHRFNALLERLHEAYGGYDFQVVAKELHEFVWDDFCDWYVELAKIQRRGETAENTKSEPQTQTVLYSVFEGLLRALHPVMPFVTEELWSQLPKSEFMSELDSIMFSPYPREDTTALDENADASMSFLIRIIKSIRDTRQIYDVQSKEQIKVFYTTESKLELQTFTTAGEWRYIEEITKCMFEHRAADSVEPGTARRLIDQTTISIPLKTIIDVEKTKQKLIARKQGVEKDLQKVSEILASNDFTLKAPPEKVAALKQQDQDLKEKLANIEQQLEVVG
jgi:valyl-tRNA synthetase